MKRDWSMSNYCRRELRGFSLMQKLKFIGMLSVAENARKTT
jgi:hypothetical protein